jgi:hypothetical protein
MTRYGVEIGGKLATGWFDSRQFAEYEAATLRHQGHKLVRVVMRKGNTAGGHKQMSRTAARDKVRALNAIMRAKTPASRQRALRALDSVNARKSNPTKKQKREKARKASVRRRVAVALAKFLKQANPAMKTEGATVTRLKGGGFTIRPIKAVKRGRR